MEGYTKTVTTVEKNSAGKVISINEVTETFTPFVVRKKVEEKTEEEPKTAGTDSVDGDTSHWTSSSTKVVYTDFLNDLSDIAQNLVDDFRRQSKKP